MIAMVTVVVVVVVVVVVCKQNTIGAICKGFLRDCLASCLTSSLENGDAGASMLVCVST